EGLQPIITTSELVVGQNRFAFGLLKANKLLESADVTLRVYSIDGSEAQLTAELNAPYQAIGKLKQQRSVHRHSDGTEHVHGDEFGVRGHYVTQLSFTHAGTWGIEILTQEKDGSREMARTAVSVLDTPQTPAIGSLAPRSRNLIASDVKDLRQIDTSPRPDPRLHQIRIADAIEQGKPQLIVFATPQFCTSRMCGPVVDIVRTLLPTYGKRVAFTHQEIWQDFAEKKVFPTVEEWRLFTEPWIFVVDGQGVIRAKFEGLVTARELEAALEQALKVTPGSRQ
ncbi:MAG TPA: thioredoxin family protein, partial [Candidatus Binatia bacterium]|nr:thioredoxin family protein [Candidatus Binatia bacterium]